MDKKEYLNEENYNKTNIKVKKIGNILIIVGLILGALGIGLTLFGFLGFGSAVSSGIENGQNGMNASGIFSGFGAFTIGGFLMVPSVPIIVIGLVLRFLIGNRREITAYTTQQVMPVVQESAEKMAPTAGKVAKELAKGIKEGINEANEEE